MINQHGKTAIGLDAQSQSVVIIFPVPTTQLALSADQAEALGRTLIAQAKQLKAQQHN